MIDPNTDEFVYNISTQPCSGNRLRSLDSTSTGNYPNDNLPVDDAKKILD